MSRHTVYLISPADCSGRRAGLLLAGGGNRDIAAGLRSTAGAPIGDVFTFVSGLYFRGKLLYANAFATSPSAVNRVYIIVPGRGLDAPHTPIRLTDLRKIAAIPVDPNEDRYVKPLQRDAKRLARRLHEDDAVVFLGSVASDKYTSVLHAVFAERLLVPKAFVGLGSMSRGSLLLRAAKARRQLAYIRLNDLPEQ